MIEILRIWSLAIPKPRKAFSIHWWVIYLIAFPALYSPIPQFLERIRLLPRRDFLPACIWDRRVAALKCFGPPDP